MIKKLSVFLLACAACLAQSATQKMVDLSVIVAGAIQKDGKAQAAWVGGGFILDAKHVATSSSCCGKTDQGQQMIPVVVYGDNSFATKKVWQGGGFLAILEMEKPLDTAGATLAPVKLMTQNQAGYAVQFNKDKQPPTLNETKIVGTFTMDNPKAQAFKAQPSPESVLSGSALFNACGQVAGINLAAKDGVLYGVIVDEVGPGLEAAGVQASVANGPCGGAQTSNNDPTPTPAPRQAPPPDQGKEKGGEEKEGTLPFGLRYPKGGEWVGVAIIFAILAAALRSGTRQQVARAFTGRRGPVPQPYPYPQPVYPPPQAYIPPAPPVPLPLPSRPVLHGIAGKYAGASVSLETGPSLLGRDQAVANLVFPPDSDSVSKRHCTVRWDAARGVFVLEDLGSTNGTFLANGERLAPGQPRELRPGDKFYIGDMRNQFEVRMEA